MKEGIHPDYVAAVVTCTSCNSTLHTHATVPEMRIDLCSNCHPFYTGKQRIVDTAGRVERFNQRRTAGEKAVKVVKAAARKREKAGDDKLVVPDRIPEEIAPEENAPTEETAVTSEA